MSEKPNEKRSGKLERCARTVYENLMAGMRPYRPPGFPEVPWDALPAPLQQKWRDAMAASWAEAAKIEATKIEATKIEGMEK